MFWSNRRSLCPRPLNPRYPHICFVKLRYPSLAPPGRADVVTKTRKVCSASKAECFCRFQFAIHHFILRIWLSNMPRVLEKLRDWWGKNGTDGGGNFRVWSLANNQNSSPVVPTLLKVGIEPSLSRILGEDHLLSIPWERFSALIEYRPMFSRCVCVW